MDRQKTSPATPSLLTPEQVAHQLQLSVKTLYDKRWRLSSGLRAVHIGRRSIRFRQEDVMRLCTLERHPGDGVNR